MKFKYKFESIMKVKEIFEKRAQKQVALIQLEIEKKEEEYNSLLELRLKENKKYVKLCSASDLKFHKDYLASLKADMEKIRKTIDQLLTEKEKKLVELIDKTKEHQILSAMEEKHYTDFLTVQNKIEMDGINEIAVQKFTRDKN